MAMDSAQRSYVFNDIRIDTVAHRLLRAGAVVSLEPRVFAVLIELVAHPGELLRRDQLLDAVWGHRHVTPSVLNRAVATLRRELGDDSDNPRYIETVHGLGYRFIGTLREAVANGGAQGAAPPRNGQMESDPAPAGTAPVSVAHRRPWLRDSRLVLWFVLTCVALGASMLVLRFAPGDRGTRPRNDIVVLPFSATGGGGEFIAQAESLAGALISALVRTPVLRVVGHESAFAVRGSRPSHAAALVDSSYALSGIVRHEGRGRATVSVSLWKQGSEQPLWSDQRTVLNGQLIAVVSPLVARVRGSLSADAPTDGAVEQAPPASDLYWLGRHYLHRRSTEDIEQALSYFRRAVELDPAYALAWTGVADAYTLLYEYGDLPIDIASLESRASIARARTIVPDLAEAHASEGLLLMNEGDAEGAVAALARALALQPKLPEARLWFGNALAHSGRAHEALAWHRKMESEDPMNAVLHTYMGVDAMLGADDALASTHFRRAIELNHDYLEPYWQLALLDVFRGRLSEAAAKFGGLRGREGSISWTLLNASYVYLLAGDGVAAEAKVADAEGIPPLDHIEAGAWAAWLATGSADRWRPLALAVAGNASSRLREAVLARIDLLSARDGDALARYDRLFDSGLDRADPFFRPWLPDLGLGHFAAWIALMPQDDRRRDRAIEAYARQLERYSAGGLAVSTFHYHRAVLAALRGDCEAAHDLLATAMAEGWLDASALRRDPAWRSCATRPWIASVQATLDSRASGQRARMSGARSAEVPAS